MEAFSRYELGQGRSAQVDLLLEDEDMDFYSHEDLLELSKIENSIVNLFLGHVQCGFMNQNQILEAYQQTYSRPLQWEEFARTSDGTFEEFLGETWDSFKVIMCPKDQVTWIGVNLPNFPKLDNNSLEAITTKPCIKEFSRIMYDVKVWDSQHQDEEEKTRMKTENILWKLRHLVMNKTIASTCCIKFMYKILYERRIDISSTKYKSLEELLEESVNWRKIGDSYMMVKTTDQKFGELKRKKWRQKSQDYEKISELQRMTLSILTGEYFGDVMY
ncbi:9446_t:CDS:2 [Acaulospora morrowiae]|uniref:9446_t:CDS:1 n=1 Tax=Acaulospora morrowiae TaxID=94023 RepID=A0A9N8YRM8_9GLOM|nr:9446_t:CDS:2 [Acaulospora morrowiae]